MKDRTYQAIQFQVTRHFDAVNNPDEPWENHPAYDTTLTRYRIVSTETGEVLDDAQGYGYTTAQKAYAGYGYKLKRRNTKMTESKQPEPISKKKKNKKPLTPGQKEAMRLHEQKMRREKIIQHNEDIIKDNLFFGLKGGCSQKEINDYRKEAYAELNALRAYLKNGGTKVILNKETELYEIP